MVIVSDTEIKNRLDELLSTAESGQTVAITRNGKAILHIAPAPKSIDDASRERDIDDLIRRRREWEQCSVSRENILKAVHEGRK